MFSIKRTRQFDTWFAGLRDMSVKVRLARRLERASNGVLGDVEPVGGGVSEMREHFGAGWRMYYVKRGAVLVVMLGGGTKATQQRDVGRAINLAATIED